MSDSDEITKILKNVKLTPEELEAAKIEAKKLQTPPIKPATSPGIDLTPSSPEQAEYLQDLMQRRQANIAKEQQNTIKKLSELKRPTLNKQLPSSKPWIDPEDIRDIDVSEFKKAKISDASLQKMLPKAELEIAKRSALMRMLGKAIPRAIEIGTSLPVSVGAGLLESEEANVGADVPVGPALTEEEMLNLLKRRSNK